jgi:hypothetical protein
VLAVAVDAGRSTGNSRVQVPKKSRGLAVARPSSPRPPSQSKDDAAPEQSLLRADRPSWLTSLVVHAALLLALSFWTIATFEREDLALWASDTPREETLDEFPEFTVDPSVDLASFETEAPSEIDDPGIATLGNLTGEAELADVAADGLLAAADSSTLGALFGDDTNGLSDVGPEDAAASVSFFGTKSQARRVVFVIDNTGSMRHGEFETVVAELLKAVNAMDPGQQFYVFFYSDQVYPLFFPQTQATCIRATPENKQLLEQWLDSVELCTGGVWELVQALEAAYKLKPDVIYLLSDGNRWDAVRADYKIAAVERLKTERNPLGIPIHTLGMGCKGEVDRQNLERVAEANYGIFREVKVRGPMKLLAQQKSRPYYDWNTGPGPVWGTAVAKSDWGKDQPATQ